MTSSQIAPTGIHSSDEVQTLARELPSSDKGPITKRVQRRALLIYSAIACVGMLLALLGESDRLTAFGLGMLFPGAGLIYTGQWIALGLTAILFVIALALWPATGNILAAPLVWLGAASYGAYHAGHPAMSANHEFALWLVPACVILLYVYARVKSRKQFQQDIETLKRRNREYLSAISFEPQIPPSFDQNYWRELSLEELQEVRFVLDRALQPLDKFEGYDFLEGQFQIAAVRYQLYVSGYALGLMHYHATPSFQGYLRQAQRNLIEKQLDKRVWGFWRWESLWGNLTTNFDPVKKDNIMMTGWGGQFLGHYATTCRDDYFSKPGSLTFRYDNDKKFEYDIHTMAECVYQNHKKSRWTLFPCEPNWIYNMCNEVSVNYLCQHDRVYGTNYYADIKDDYIAAIDNEFTAVNGHSIPLRSQHLGFEVAALTSGGADATFGLWGNPTKPLQSQRAWQIFRNDYSTVDSEGNVKLDTHGWWENIDIGSYKPSQISNLGFASGFAREMGDKEYADNCVKTQRKNYNYVERNGVRYFDDCSTYANIINVMGRMLRKNALSHLVNHNLPETITEGPYLAECEYPKVLVAKAVSLKGDDLELVLYPGSSEAEHKIEIASLSRSSNYVLEYPESNVRVKVTSDVNGKLTVNVNLDGRTYIRLTPA